jgi:hypothetical protein
METRGHNTGIYGRKQTAGKARQENSLGELTKKFIKLIQQSDEKKIDLNDAVN